MSISRDDEFSYNIVFRAIMETVSYSQRYFGKEICKQGRSSGVRGILDQGSGCGKCRAMSCGLDASISTFLTQLGIHLSLKWKFGHCHHKV